MLQTPRTFVGVELEDPSADEGEASPRPRNFLRRWGLVTGSFVLSAALLLFAAARVLQMGVDSPQATDKVAEQNEVLLSETVSVPGQSQIREDPLAELPRQDQSSPDVARSPRASTERFHLIGRIGGAAVPVLRRLGT
jgi:hypothetical protein